MERNSIPDDPEPTGGLQLHPQPELSCGQHRAEIRSDEGQRLDNARAEFRAAWRAKVERKRQQARTAVNSFAHLRFWAKASLMGFTSFGGVLGCIAGMRSGALSEVLIMTVGGAAFGSTLALLLASILLVCAWLCGRCAEQLELEARVLKYL